MGRWLFCCCSSTPKERVVSSLKRRDIKKLMVALQQINDISEMNSGWDVPLSDWAASVNYFCEAALLILYGGSHAISHLVPYKLEYNELLILAKLCGVYKGLLRDPEEIPRSGEIGRHTVNYQNYLKQRANNAVTPSDIIAAAEAIIQFHRIFASEALQTACVLMHEELQKQYRQRKDSDPHVSFPILTVLHLSPHAKSA